MMRAWMLTRPAVFRGGLQEQPLVVPPPERIEADDWYLNDGALRFVRGDRSWLLIAAGQWTRLEEVTPP